MRPVVSRAALRFCTEVPPDLLPQKPVVVRTVVADSVATGKLTTFVADIGGKKFPLLLARVRSRVVLAVGWPRLRARPVAAQATGGEGGGLPARASPLRFAGDASARSLGSLATLRRLLMARSTRRRTDVREPGRMSGLWLCAPELHVDASWLCCPCPRGRAAPCRALMRLAAPPQALRSAAHKGGCRRRVHFVPVPRRPVFSRDWRH